MKKTHCLLLVILIFYSSSKTFSQSVIASFTAPDSVCPNSQINIQNTSTGATSYYWNFCTANINQSPVGTNIGNPGGLLNTPVYIDYVLTNGNYYGFVTNNYPGGLVRLDFGNSLLNTPVATNLGTIGGAIPSNTEGIQIANDNGNWYLEIVGGDVTDGAIPSLTTVSLGTNIDNNAPTATNWGNIGNLSYPHDLYVFNANGLWYGLTANFSNNTVTRFELGASLASTPTAVNLGNIGNLNGPTGIQAINDNGVWRVFVTNALSSTLTRLDFGSSLLNTPTGVNLGNPNNAFTTSWDIYVLKYCGENEAYVINANGAYDIVKLDFGSSLANTPTAISLGNQGSLDFPHCISKLFRVGPNVYSFIANVNSNSLTLLEFAGCNNASISNSALQNPPSFSYAVPGVYNISLDIDDGLPTQTSFCKQLLVTNCIPQPLDLCTTSQCPLVNSIVISTGYNDTSKTSLQPGQKDTNWIITAISNDMRNAFCNSNTSIAGQPSGVSVSPNVVGQPAFAIESFPQWPQSGTYVSCFPFNTMYTNPPAVSNFTNCTMDITRNFYVCSNNNQNVNFNFTVTTDDYTIGIIIDSGSANPITLFAGANPLFTPLSINATENLSPGVHTLTIEAANYEDLNGQYFTLPSGASAQWNPFGIAVNGTISSTNNIFANDYCTSASLCTGSLGDPVVNITFGGGANPGQPLPTIVPGASTTMTYVGVTGNPATPTPVDGQYTITNNVPYNADWFSGAYDHTSNNGTGYMAFYNANQLPSEFYSQTVNNLCGSTTYQFSAWIANAVNPALLMGVLPNITFNIEQTDGSVLATYNTGNIPENTAFTWNQYGFSFTTPSNISTVVLKMINNSPGGTTNPGNDFAIDDITFSPCGPLISASFSSTSIVDSQSVCQGSNITLYGTASNGYANPGYLWQYSVDSGVTWIDIPNSNMLQLSITAPLTGFTKNYKYRMLSGQGNNISSVNCRVSSNLTVLNVIPGPNGKLSAKGICPGNSASLIFSTASAPSPFSIVWTDGTISYNDSNLNNNSSFLTPFSVSNTSSYKLHSITDANGCTNILDSVFSIAVNPLPNAYLTAGTICNGDSAIILFNATSGSSPFSIVYSVGGNVYSQIVPSNNSTFTTPYLPADTTIFTLTSVTDSNGCTAKTDTTTTINVNPLPQGGITGSTACAGDSAGITFTSSSGIGPFELEISDGVNTTTYYDVQSGIPFRITPLISTTNISLISIIDQNGMGCTRSNGFTSSNATISVIPSPVIQFDSLTPICIEQSSFLITQAKEITGIAGNGVFSGAGVDSSGNFSPSIAGVGTHTITYSYTADNGCSSADSATITVNPTPSVSAGPDLITCIGFPVQLKATGGSTYIWSPATGLDNPGIASPVANIDSSTTYIVLGTDSNGCYATDTITINVNKNGIAGFVVPSAFTPNGDGHNDCFGITHWGGVTITEFTIFNRWGQLVFTTKNPSDCWDGTYQGKKQEAGGYPFIIKVKSPCGDITRTGIVMLIR